MRKRILFIAVIVLMIILSCFIIVKLNTSELDLKQLSGELLLENKIDKENYTFGAINYTTYNGNTKMIFNEDHYTPYCFNQDKSKILLLKYIENPTLNDYVIFEYDIKTKTLSGIVKFKEKENNQYPTVIFRNIRYIPDKNRISYLWYDELYVFDMDLKKETLVAKIDQKANSYYSWSNDGNKLIYSKNDEINILELLTGNNIFATSIKGYSPIYSPSGENISYLDYNGNFKHSLKVKNIKTGEEWAYNTKSIIVNYVFSPDNKYLAIVEKDVGLIKIGDHVAGHIKVWDFKNSSFTTLVKYYEGDTIDWK